MSRIPSLHDVCRIYGEPPVTTCVRVSLVAERKEFVAIVNPSESGRSTLFNFIGTLDRPTSGTIEIDGTDVSRFLDCELSALRVHLVGFVFQQLHLSKGMDAVDNVADDLLYLGVPRVERRQKAETALIRAGLSHRLYHKPHQMSGGERRRVTIARAAVGDPPLLLTDEPTGDLDSVSDTSIVELLHELHEQGTTIVVIIHDSDLTSQLPRRVAIKDGHIVHDPAAKETAHI